MEQPPRPETPSRTGAASPAADLRADTQVERVREASSDGAPALYRADLSDRWSAAFFPFGGFVSALAARAIEAELARPEHRLRTLTTVFASPVKAGPVEIEVSRLRAGRGMSQLRARVRNAGTSDAGHETLAVLGASRPGPFFTQATPPPAPPPQDCDPPPEPPPGHRRWHATFFDQIEVRQWKMHAPWEPGWEGGRAEATRWMRYRVAPRLGDGTIDPLALIALCDTMPPSLGQRLGPGHPPFLAPSCDLTVHVLQPTRDAWLLAHAVTAHCGEGYASATLELWDRSQRLVARATQLMYLRMDVDGNPRTVAP